MTEIHTPLMVELDPNHNLNNLLAARVAANPDAVLIERRQAPGAPWEPLTSGQFEAEVVAVAKGLVARGVEPGDRVGIMSHTRYEWTLLDWAIWAAGAVSVPLYETSSAEQVQWILSDSEVQLLVVESPEYAAIVDEVRAEVPTLETVLVIDDGGVADLTSAGTDVTDDEIARRRGLAVSTDIATIIYTSGTTGRPKGAELSHGNFHVLAVNIIVDVPEVFGRVGSRTLLFMPLAHVFARFIGVLVVAGGTVLSHASDTRTLIADLQSFKPTYILAVPRVFEKVYNSAEQQAARSGKRRIFHWAVAVAIEYSRSLDTGRRRPWLRAQRALFDRLVYRKLRALLGDDVEYAVSGGAPLGERLGHFYRGIGITVLEGYGLTETTAPTCLNHPGNIRVGTVGTQLPGCGVTIAEDGEILLKGVNVFLGYHNNPEATAQVMSDGWFRTGDLGSLDEDGFLRITGRKKEIIVTAGGKNVAPAVLEDRIRAHALVSQCVAVGDHRPFIGALITLDPEGLPGWLQVHGKPDMEVETAAKDPDVLAALDAAVQRANRAVSRAESIRKFSVLTTDFTVENGYLTPSLKVRRAVVLKDFAAEIDAIYDGGSAS